VNVSDNRTFRPGSESLGARIVAAEDRMHIAWIDNESEIRYAYGRGPYWPDPISVTDRRATAGDLSMQLALDRQIYLAWDETSTLRVTASSPRAITWPDPVAVPTRLATASDRVSQASLAVSGEGIAVAWVASLSTKSVGVYESRHNMLRPMLKSFAPVLLQP
jgi:hypothetical protein